MKSYPILGIAPFLASCSVGETPSEVAKCEQEVLAKLDNPESYVRDRNDSLNLGDRWQVGIEFGYIDDSGEQVDRAWRTCDFSVVDGEPDTSRFLKLESSLDRADNSASD